MNAAEGFLVEFLGGNDCGEQVVTKGHPNELTIKKIGTRKILLIA